jgi:hypothetical protein
MTAATARMIHQIVMTTRLMKMQQRRAKAMSWLGYWESNLGQRKRRRVFERSKMGEFSLTLATNFDI